MSKFLILSLFISFSALAHVEPGTYTGKDQQGVACTFTVGGMFFENDMHHPLTERLQLANVTFNGKMVEIVSWTLGHPPVVNTDLGINRYNHDIFQQIVPVKTGATSVTLIKGKEKEGDDESIPVGIIYIEDNYKNKADSRNLTCLL